MLMFNNKEEKIKKSKEIIKKEKQKIKIEKKKLKQQKKEKFYQSKIGKKLKKIFPSKDNKKEKQEITLKSQILSMIYFTIIGFVLCLLTLYVLSGGKNYFKLYSELNKLIETYNTITSNYYGELSKEELVDSAIDSMLNSIGDKYTTYSDIDSANEFTENIDGTYEGIGCTVAMNEEGEIIVVSIFEDSPAEKAGLKENDIIIEVDGKDYTEKTSNEVAEYVKSKEESTIEMTIIRDGEQQEITITRNKVEIPTVTSKVYEQNENKIGYIQISIFSSVTKDQLSKELKKLEEDENIEGLIIDVRNNSGGYLSIVTDIADMFLKKNKVIYQLQDDNETIKKKATTKEYRDYPIAILINKNSASASEILASAIKESYGGEVVGVNSYGKGTVQKTKILSDGSMIKYTVQKWLTPTGEWINEKGITPTKYVELETNGEDNQLKEALNIIKEKISK